MITYILSAITFLFFMAIDSLVEISLIGTTITAVVLLSLLVVGIYKKGGFYDENF